MVVIDGVPVIEVLPNGKHCPVLLMTHFDVVDAPDEQFAPEVRDGKLYGRGAFDDKYAVALSMVLAAEYCDRLRKQGRGQGDLPFGLLITGDEETGGFSGAATALERVSADFCIALDGGNLGKVVTREKGLMELRLTAHGTPSHGSRPWLGANAIEILMQDLLTVKSFFSETRPDHWHRTVNIGTIRAGNSPNQVPALAEAVVDIRYTEDDDPDRLIESITGAVKSEVTVLFKEPLFAGGQSEWFQRLMAATPRSEQGVDHCASDARFLSRHGIDGVVWGADGDDSAHAADEHVDLESVYELYRRLDRFLSESMRG
jgi:succinyl-diaminopimelate desuccinylase